MLDSVVNIILSYLILLQHPDILDIKTSLSFSRVMLDGVVSIEWFAQQNLALKPLIWTVHIQNDWDLWLPRSGWPPDQRSHGCVPSLLVKSLNFT